MRALHADPHRTLFTQWHCALVLVLLFAPLAWSEGANLERAKAALEGNWRLEESLADGAVLHPPQADGRMSIQGGVIMISMHREIQGTRTSNYGYGTYAFTPDTWIFGFDRYASFTDTGSAITAAGAPFEGKRAFQIKSESDKLILDYDNGNSAFVFEGDAMNFLGKGKVLRKWRRMPAQ